MFATRPYDVFVPGAAIVAALSPAPFNGVALGAVPFAPVVFAYRNAQFGSVLRDGYQAHARLFGKSPSPGPLGVVPLRLGTRRSKLRGVRVLA
ncbi:MAG: hypothetical protein M3O46_02625 [Myxococcota bacterium]|nr:hypothetical protein [Myxococcota bacterium]